MRGPGTFRADIDGNSSPFAPTFAVPDWSWFDWSGWHGSRDVDGPPGRPTPPDPVTIQFRSFDGSGNNLGDTGLNATGTEVSRIGPAYFADGISELIEGPNPRTISNVVVGEGDADVANPQGVSAFMYAWGQFIDHDLTLTRSDGVNRIDIEVPDGDPLFGDDAIIPMARAVIDPSTGEGTGKAAVPLNFSTAWLDGSIVYGSDAATAASLRTADGHMKTSAGNNLPVVNGMFAAGDPRASENFALTSLHTLFVREHNYWVDQLHKEHPRWTGDQLYNYARAIGSAEIANITYKEFLPNLIGSGVIAPYTGYKPGVDPHLTLEFNIAFRFGHSIVSAETESLDENGEVMSGTERPLREIFFAPPSEFLANGGADGQLRHLAADPSQAMDVRIVEDLRNFLFDPPGAMDLAALNIQRERDFGVGSLNEVRERLGLARYTDIDEITTDEGTRAALKLAFGNDVDLIDLWTGGLAENSAPGAMVGETFQMLIAMQFQALRDGDRFWFENQGFDGKTLNQIEGTSLAEIILRNTDTQHIQDDVFVTYTRHTGQTGGVASEDPGAKQLVIGSNGHDTLIGGPQGDYLFAGTGRQTLTGLAGADHFVFDKGATHATITDFQPGIDKLEFAHAGTTGWHFSDRDFDDSLGVTGMRVLPMEGGTLVLVGDDRIELPGVQWYELSRNDFIFNV